MKSHETFANKSNEELKTIAENRSGLFNEISVSASRVELLGRGLVEIEGQWVIDAITQSILDLQAEIKKLRSELPTTGLVSPSFWTRAMAVLGHALAIQLIVIPVVFVMAAIFR
jgi:hypothetical protein